MNLDGHERGMRAIETILRRELYPDVNPSSLAPPMGYSDMDKAFKRLRGRWSRMRFASAKGLSREQFHEFGVINAAMETYCREAEEPGRRE